MNRVLLVEDNFLIGLELRGVLASIGAEVCGPHASKRAWRERHDEGPLDLAVLDINIRGGTSFGIARSLRARGVPIIFVTGFTEATEIPDDLRDAPHLIKPVERDVMVGVVKGLLGAPADR